jgi:plastocyanin
MRRRLAAAALVGAGVVASAGSAASTAAITIPGKFYAPPDVDVLVGTTVTWRNADRSTHTVTEDDDVFDSGLIRPGGEFTRTFMQTGRFAFHCTIHRFMRGSVNVFAVVLRGPEAPLPAGRRAVLSGVAPAGASEVVLERVLPGPAREVARAKPDAEGGFRFAVFAPEPRRYRVTAGHAKSPLVRVRVAPRVSIDRRGASFEVRALPARAGAPIALQRYDRDLFTFVTVAHGRLDARSRALVRYRPHGREHLRAVVRGTRGWSDGASRPILVSARES